MKKWLILEIISILLALVGVANALTASGAAAGAPESNVGTDLGVTIFWGLIAWWANGKRKNYKPVTKKVNSKKSEPEE